MSMIGVPSNASRLRTRTRRPSIAETSTRCSPMGFGRWGDRVLKTPSFALEVSPRGCTVKTSRRGAIEPGDDDDLIAEPDALETLKDIRIEDQPGFGCAFVGLPWGRREIGEGGLDHPNRLQTNTRHVRLLMSAAGLSYASLRSSAGST